MEPEAQDLSWDIHLEEPSKFWRTAIQSQTLLPILAPKPEPSFVEGWLDRNIDCGGGTLFWLSIAAFTTLVSSVPTGVQDRGSSCLRLDVKKAVSGGS